jgi:hypothetical protein
MTLTEDRPVATGVVSPDDVAVIEWPAEEQQRQLLCRTGRPRLLILDREHPPPAAWDELEDWVRTPIDPVELAARITTLQRRTRLARCGAMLDHNGVLWRNGRWVEIPVAQVPVMRLLLDRVGQLVASDEIRAAYRATGGSVAPTALKTVMTRLRRRVAVLELQLHNLPGRGSLLEMPLG